MKIKFLSIFSVAVIALASCSSSDFDENENNGNGNSNSVEFSDVPVEFGSSIGGVSINPKPFLSPLTRVNGGKWENNEKIGIYMVDASTPSTDLHKNAEYKNGSGQHLSETYENFIPVSSTDQMYYPTTGNVEFLAYYPYSTAASNGIYPSIKVSDQAKITDFLYANITAGNYNKKTSTAVKLDFEHKLAKLSITVTYSDAGFTEPESDTEVKLSNYYEEGDFDLKNAKFINLKPDFSITSNTSTITMDQFAVNPRQTEFEASLLPQEIKNDGSMKWTFTVEGNDYTFDPYNTNLTFDNGTTGNFTKLESGKDYKFKIQVTRYQVKLLEGKVIDWVDGGTGSGIAE